MGGPACDVTQVGTQELEEQKTTLLVVYREYLLGQKGSCRRNTQGPTFLPLPPTSQPRVLPVHCKGLADGAKDPDLGTTSFLVEPAFFL